MPAALARAVGVPAQQDHHHAGHQIGDGRDQADGEGVLRARGLDQLGHPEHQAVDAAGQAHVDQRQGVGRRLAQRGAEMVGVGLLGIAADHVAPELLVAGIEPFGVLDLIVQMEPDNDAQDDGRNAFEQEQPLPALQAHGAIGELHDAARDRPADHAAKGDARHEDGVDAAPALGREPLGEVVQRARHEAGLQRADQEADEVKPHLAADEHGAGRGNAPGDHDAHDPDPRPHAVQDHVAGHFEQEVADKEDAGPQAVHRIGKTQLALHLQLGEADVHAVQIGHHPADHQQGHEAPEDLAVDRLLA
ncbi:hypothetical protein D3C71_1334150 [compost metagenome]